VVKSTLPVRRDLPRNRNNDADGLVEPVERGEVPLVEGSDKPRDESVRSVMKTSHDSYRLQQPRRKE
jgi:hypothetical protein